MNTENTTRGAVGFFAVILVGSLVAAVLGGGFGVLLATISPEFVSDLFGRQSEVGIVRYAFAVGMIWGLFIGAAVSGFACLLSVVIKILRIRLEYQKGKEGGSV